MLNKYTFKELTWVDLESPTDEEVRSIVEEYKINPRIGEELRNPTHRSKMDAYKDTLFLVLHFPAFKHSHNGNTNQEVDFILGKDFMITVHYDSIDTLHKFSKEFEVNTILEKNNFGDHAGHLFFFLLRKLYKSVSHELEYIEALLSEIENSIFQGEEREMVRDISEVSRVLLDFRQTVGGHREAMESLVLVGIEFYGVDFNYHLKTIALDQGRVYHSIEHLRETIFDLRETNMALLSTNQNEAMKVLTIMAFVTFPLSLIASIFGMNTEYLPIVGEKNDFWIVMGIMATLTLIFFIFFKHKRWL